MWPPDSEAGEANREWVRSAWQAIKPFSTGGSYTNFQTFDEDADRISETYRGNLTRLREVKAAYDPDNLFRVNRSSNRLTGPLKGADHRRRVYAFWR